MSRRFNPDLCHAWKVNLPATLAGQMEFVLRDELTNKPLYGARAKLLSALLEHWLAKQAGTPDHLLPHVPSIAELRLS